MTEQSKVRDDEGYKEYITGAPAAITYQVEDPTNGLVFHFDAFMDGSLVYVVHDYAGHFAHIEQPIDSLDQAYVDIARLQLAVSQGYPVVWFAQQADDAERLKVVLSDAGFGQIVIEHRP